MIPIIRVNNIAELQCEFGDCKSLAGLGKAVAVTHAQCPCPYHTQTY